jgi:ParB family chromosome partitioning protein
MQEEKPNQKEQLKVPVERIRKYFKADVTPKQMMDTIEEALKLYQKRERNRAERER